MELKLQQQLHAVGGGFQFNFVSEAVMIEDLDLLAEVPRNKVSHEEALLNS